ncbi:MAG: ATP-binding protein [Gemmatimonadaceae bacterium]
MITAEQKVAELLTELSVHGEHSRIEAKAASEIGRSVLETVCAFTNEPGLDGGHLLLGVAQADIGDLFDPPAYKPSGIANAENVADDLASQCASAFNRPLRPQITPVSIEGRTVLHVRVFEAAPGEKPVFLKGRGLPGGAFRRIGATDQTCTEDDLQVLYEARRRSPYDADLCGGARWSDIDVDAIEEYRAMRREVSPGAEELRYGDEDLLRSLNCASDADGEVRPTVAGILLFGTTLALRRFYGMMRIDYIRVQGNEWVPDPDNRYTTIDIRGPLIRAVRRAETAVVDDLPKAFSLPEGSLQRRDIPSLPRQVLREALVNAVMHRDYRVHGAVQIIRYSNRIEIQNPGYSLKSPDRLGEPGSEARNPTIAAVFHETNLAETKGTGIRAMRRLMREAELVPPTFESDRKANRFTARLLLHHFLGEEDLQWLDGLGVPGLSQEEKLVLMFVREVGAVDNATYRDLTAAETLKASSGLRHLCELGLLEKRGQSSATYYVPADQFLGRAGAPLAGQRAESSMAGGKPDMGLPEPDMVSAQPTMLRPDRGATAGGPDAGAELDRRDDLKVQLPDTLLLALAGVGPHADEATMRHLLGRLCSHRAYSAEELARLLGRNPRYLKAKYLSEMLRAGELRYTIPDMPKHPNQAYEAADGTR